MYASTTFHWVYFVCFFSLLQIRERSLFKAGESSANRGGGLKFQCKEIEGGGKISVKAKWGGGKISMHRYLRAVLNFSVQDPRGGKNLACEFWRGGGVWVHAIFGFATAAPPPALINDRSLSTCNQQPWTDKCIMYWPTSTFAIKYLHA